MPRFSKIVLLAYVLTLTGWGARLTLSEWLAQNALQPPYVIHSVKQLERLASAHVKITLETRAVSEPFLHEAITVHIADEKGNPVVRADLDTGFPGTQRSSRFLNIQSSDHDKAAAFLTDWMNLVHRDATREKDDPFSPNLLKSILSHGKLIALFPVEVLSIREEAVQKPPGSRGPRTEYIKHPVYGPRIEVSPDPKSVLNVIPGQHVPLKPKESAEYAFHATGLPPVLTLIYQDGWKFLPEVPMMALIGTDKRVHVTVKRSTGNREVQAMRQEGKLHLRFASQAEYDLMPPPMREMMGEVMRGLVAGGEKQDVYVMLADSPQTVLPVIPRRSCSETVDTMAKPPQ